jgi:Holliday junction resolvase RusA-like endonuclease
MNKIKQKFNEEKNKNYPDRVLLKSLLIQIYEKEVGEKVDLDKLTSEEQLKMIRWFNLNLIQKIGITYNRDVKVKIPYITASLSHKVSQISQFHCPLCNNFGNSQILIIPIRISAISKQAMSKKPSLRKAFEKAVQSRIKEKNRLFRKSDKICVFVTFVMGKKSKDKDLDNMSKALMDALQGSLFESDANIDHLNLIKIKHDGDEDFVKINIRKSNVNDHSDVLFPIMAHNWLGSQFLELKDFLE